VARLGGDEFVVLCEQPQAGGEVVKPLALPGSASASSRPWSSVLT
jgi:GGDEF domain-containing protein